MPWPSTSVSKKITEKERTYDASSKNGTVLDLEIGSGSPLNLGRVRDERFGKFGPIVISVI